MSLLRNVLERSVAAIAIKNVAIQTRDKDIGIAVVIVICNRDAIGIAFTRNARLLGNVRESPIAVVMKKAIRILRPGLLQRRHLRAVGEKHIHAAVVVVVED